jgi:hypothetical protein
MLDGKTHPNDTSNVNTQSIDLGRIADRE